MFQDFTREELHELHEHIHRAVFLTGRDWPMSLDDAWRELQALDSEIHNRTLYMQSKGI